MYKMSTLNHSQRFHKTCKNFRPILQCVWLILSRKFFSSPAGRKLCIWCQASQAGSSVFTEVNWLKLRYILHIMIWYSPCSQKVLYVLSIFLYARFTPFQKNFVHTH